MHPRAELIMKNRAYRVLLMGMLLLCFTVVNAQNGGSLGAVIKGGGLSSAMLGAAARPLRRRGLRLKLHP